MSNYTKSTNFATKDNLSPGDPLKIVRGTEIDTEFNNIATAVSTKTDNSAAAITGGSITGITDLAVADGGTGASTAAGGLNNLLPTQTGNANKYLQTDGTNATWDAVTLSTADITGTLPVANGGTGVTSSTGTGSTVLSNSPTLVTPALGTPASGVATNMTGLPISTGVSGLGTGVATFLGTPSSANLISAVTDETGTGSLVFATSPTLVTPALGTPSALVGTNITGTASGLTAGNVTTNANLTGAVTSVGNATSLGSFTSSQLAGALTDETGSGSAVFATSPTLVTPILGTPTSATLTNATGLPIGTGVSGLGTGIATALAVNTGSAGAPVLFNGALGTPSGGTLTSATGLPLTTGVTGILPTANGGTNLTSFTSGGVVYASSTSALATGSALTFNGTKLATTGYFNASGMGIFQGSLTTFDAASGGLYAYYSSGGVIASYSDNSGTLAQLITSGSVLLWRTGGTEKMRLDASGNVGIGTSSPSTKLHLGGSSDQTIQVNGSGTAAFVGVSTSVAQISSNRNPTTGTIYDSGRAVSYINLEAANGDGNIQFYTTATNNVNATERVRISASGTVKTFSTISVGAATPSSCGAGISFPASQSASSDANTLDDYEEGTFTPVLEGTTTAGAGTYTVQNGFYTKIGNKVFIQLTLRWTAHTGTGNMKITGLPFTSNGTGVNPVAYICYFDNIALTALYYPTAVQDQGTAFIVLRQAPTGGGSNTNIPMDTSGNIEGMCGNYFI